MAHVFGSDGVGFGTLSGWSITGNDSDDAFKRAEAAGPTGNETVSVLFDETETVSTSYIASSATTPTVPATLGATINSISLLGISLSTSADGYVTMTLTGHRHVAGTHGTLRTVAHGITLSRAFGCSGFGVTSVETTALFSSSCNIETQHIDVPGQTGNTIAGENYDCSITIEVTATGTLTADLSGYDTTSIKTPQGNTEFKKQSRSYVKHLAMA